MIDRPRLTHRQWLVWACYVSGMTMRQTAESTGCGYETVKDHLRNIRRKFGTTGLDRIALDRPVDHE